MATPKWPKAMMKSECQPSFLIEGYVLCLHFGLAFVCLTVRCTTDQSSSMHNWPRISRGGERPENIGIITHHYYAVVEACFSACSC